MMLFELVRNEDPSGVSGLGVIAQGVMYDDETVALRWRGHSPSTAVWDSLEKVLAVHGHGGKTIIRFMQADTWPTKYLNLAGRHNAGRSVFS